jgi:Xaa-Pro aminopeptidase
MWSKKQIEDHRTAARSLVKIKDLTFEYIRKNDDVTEYDVQQFIIKKFDEFGIHSDKYPPIVSFGTDTSIPEFYPKKDSKRLEKGNLIMIDLWAKLNNKDAPFADITWLAYQGKKIPTKIQKVFNTAITARDDALEYIRKELHDGNIPTGIDVDKIVRDVIIDAGFEKNILHETGHSIGIIEDHGPKPDWIYWENFSRLNKNLAYTIEPGIYLKDEFGVRVEMDFYISDGNKLIITTELQKKIIIV